MSNEGDKALVPVEQRDIDFYGDVITAAMVEVDGRQVVYIPIRPLCDFLGIAWSCLLYTSPSPRDRTRYRMPSSA